MPEKAGGQGGFEKERERILRSSFCCLPACLLACLYRHAQTFERARVTQSTYSRGWWCSMYISVD